MKKHHKIIKCQKFWKKRRIKNFKNNPDLSVYIQKNINWLHEYLKLKKTDSLTQIKKHCKHVQDFFAFESFK